MLVSDPVVKEFGIGLAVAIALPRWMQKLVPKVQHRGEYFARRDAEAAAGAKSAAAAAPASD